MERKTFLLDSARYAALAVAGSSLFQNKLIASPAMEHHILSSLNASNNMETIPHYQNVTTTVRLKGKDVKVHALCTGTVAVKRNFKTKKGFGELAKLNILLDSHYTDYLPIWVWVIEHPDGLIVVDTGENSGIKDLDKYLAKESAFMRFQFKHAAKFGIEPKDELDHQFESINLKLDDVKLVVLTHLHLDHTDGLHFFPKQEIIVGDFEFKNPNSNMPSTYPSFFKPHTVEYTKDRLPIFDQAYPITAGEDLMYIPTPGHTHGHSSVVFCTDDFDIIFAGDTSYDQGQVLRAELAGVNADYAKTLDTYTKLKGYASLRKTIYLPTHDENSASRLAQRQFLIG